MSFTIVIIIFTILAGIAGWLLANHCSVYALVPVTFFLLALAVAGCMVYGANLGTGSRLGVGAPKGYFSRLFFQQF